MSGPDDVRSASEDPLGDPADQEKGIAPASQDPQGDPGVEGVLQQYAGEGSQPSEADAMQHVDQVQAHPEFGNAVSDHLGDMPPEQFSQQADQATQQMAPQQVQSTAQGLLGALQERGINVGQITSMLGLGGSQPQQMGAQDLSKLLGWTQQNQPEALGSAVAGAPGLLKSLGGPVVIGVLASLARRLLGSPAHA